MTVEDGCVYCGLPLEVEREYTMTGAGFGPAFERRECLVTFARVRCPAGHFYDEEVSSVELIPDPPPTCGSCGSPGLTAHYQADPKPGGYGPGDPIPSSLVGIVCDDCGAIQ